MVWVHLDASGARSYTDLSHGKTARNGMASRARLEPPERILVPRSAALRGPVQHPVASLDRAVEIDLGG